MSVKKVYNVFQTKTEVFYQEVMAESLEEAIELSDDCDNELVPVDGTISYTIDRETTKELGEK